MEKRQGEKDTSKVSKELEEAIGGMKKSKEVRENLNKHGFIKC